MKTAKSMSPEKNRAGFGFRRMLITGQFTLCLLLIGSAIVARKQFKYLNETNLGLQKEQVLAITSVPGSVKDQFKVFKDQLVAKSGILGVSACMEAPSSEIRDAGNVVYEGMTDHTDEAPSMDIQPIDPDFTDLMGMELLAGRPLSKSLASEPIPDLNGDEAVNTYFKNRKREYLINETAMHKMGWTNPQEVIGRQISWGQNGGYMLQTGPIVGVVKDFHQETLKNAVDPIVMVYEPLWLNTFLIKLSTGQISDNIATISKTWNGLFPQYPFEYVFVDELYEKLYKTEQEQLQLLYALSGLAILIAFLGLFGLVAYSLKTRTKEIAIRRVLGAELGKLLILFGKEYVAIVVLATVIAVPVSYYFVSVWLQDYAYRITISWTSYLIAFCIILLIPVVTILYHTVRGLSVNPVESLREN